MNLSKYHLEGILFLALIVSIFFIPLSANAAITVRIAGPSESNLFSNRSYSFLFYVANEGSDLSSADLRLEVEINGGRFVEAEGTDSDHFSILPAADDNPAIFRIENDNFDSNHVKIAIAQIAPNTAGTPLVLNAILKLGNDEQNTASYSRSVIEPTQPDSLNLSMQILAQKRKQHVLKIIQMYKNYMNERGLFSDTFDQDDLGNELLGMVETSQDVVEAVEYFYLMSTNPAAGVFKAYLDVLGFSTGQPGLMDIMELVDGWFYEIFKDIYHYDEGHYLVKLSADDPNSKEGLDWLASVIQMEADAWIDERYDEGYNEQNVTMGVYHAIASELYILMRIGYRAGLLKAKASSEGHQAGEAYFTAIVNYTKKERDVLENLLTIADIASNERPILSTLPNQPVNEETNVSVEQITFSWNCTDNENDTVRHDIYIQGPFDQYPIKINEDPIPQTQDGPVSFTYKGPLEPETIYNWFVIAQEVDLTDYISEGPQITSKPEWSFTTAPASKAEILAFFVSKYAGVDKPVEVDALVQILGRNATLKCELLDGSGNLIKVLYGPETLNSNTDLQHIKFVFSHDSAITGNVKLSLSDGGQELTSQLQPIEIKEPINALPALVSMEVEGTSQEGTNIFYDVGPITISFYTWDDGDLSQVQWFMKYAFSTEEPVNWSSEVQMSFQGTSTYNYSGSDITVAKHSHIILEDVFGPLADGQKNIWIKPTRVSDGVNPEQTVNRVIQVPYQVIKDDDDEPPQIRMRGLSSGEEPLFVQLTSPRRMDFSIEVVDPMILLSETVIDEYSSGVSEIKIGHAITDSKPTATMSDDEFSFISVSPDESTKRVAHVTGGINLQPESENKWFTLRTVAIEDDVDWPGDGFSLMKDVTFKIPDDDADPPEIKTPEFRIASQANYLIPVKCRIHDSSGLAVTPDNMNREARIYTSFDKQIWEGPFLPDDFTDDHLYEFTLLHAGTSHIGDTLYFYIEAVDGDNDRTGDSLTAVNDNNGQYYAIQIVEDMVIQATSPESGSTVEGDVVIDGTASGGYGDKTVAVKIDGNTVSNMLPFTWNTLIPSWNDPVTVLSDADQYGGAAIASSPAGEIWIAYLKDDNLYVAYSSDGSTFGTPVLAAVKMGQYGVMRPSILRSSSGRLWVAYQDYEIIVDNDGNELLYMTLYLTYSDDNGQTWSSSPIKGSNGIDVVGISFIEDSNGTLWHAFYYYDANYEMHISAVKSDDGINWTQLPDVPTTSPEYQMPIIAEGTDGNLVLFYLEYEWDSVNSKVIYTPVQTTFDGINWSTPAAFSFGWSGNYVELGRIIRDSSNRYWMSYYSNGTYLVPSEDLAAWGTPVVTPNASDFAAGDGGSMWAVYKNESDIQIIQSSREYNQTILIEATDSAGNKTTKSILVTVLPPEPNIPPVAQDQAVETDEDTPILITLAATDENDDPLTYTLSGVPNHGLLDGTYPNLTYTPFENYFGTDSFGFKANDGLDDSNVATISITINPINDPPVANEQSTATGEDTPIAIQLTGSDVEDDPLTFQVTSGPSHGALTGTPPNLVYEPQADFFGSDSFTFVSNDGTADSEPATVLITVQAENDPPIVSDSIKSVLENTPTEVLVQAEDPDGDTLTYSILTQPANGTLEGELPVVIYTPDLNYFGTDTFTYTVSDGSVTSDPVTVTLNIGAVNDPPVADSQNVSTDEDTQIAIQLTGSDVENDPLTFQVISDPAYGILTGTPPNLVYEPETDFFGSDSFSFTVSDGEFESDAATVNLVINSVNDPPVATDQTEEGIEDASLGLSLQTTDVDGDNLTFTILTPPMHGTLEGELPTASYMPEPNYFGTDSFTYEVSDGTVTSDPVTVTLNIQPVNDPPTVSDVTYNMDAGNWTHVFLSGTDIEGDEKFFSIVDFPTNGTLSGDLPVLIYTPNRGFAGTDILTYRCSDGQDESDLATITFQVAPVLLPGDVNGDYYVDLMDGIIALQIASGMEPLIPSWSSELSVIDVNGDMRIGIEEAIFVLEHISGERN